MAISEQAKKYVEKMVTGPGPGLAETDPEFVERFVNFAFDEVVNEKSAEIDDKTRFLAILSTLLGCSGLDEFRMILPAALNFGVTPVEAKEVVYQAVDYLGIGRVYPFLKITNEILSARGVRLPLASQETTTEEDRLRKGNDAQIEIFGERIRDSWTAGPENTRHISKWLADNCFGDYYTRNGLTLAQREMCTFCYLMAQGGVEPQMKSHAMGNMNMGNSAAFLIKVVSQCLPYIGYPRSLNAVRVIGEAEEAMKK
jgi:4-carboxymuconolactone decarboxylase